jgi:hypothetical protein
MRTRNTPWRRHSRSRPAALTGAAAIALITLVGCSGSNTTNNSGPTSATSQTSSATPSPTSTPTPSATVTYKPGDPRGMGAWVELGLLAARTPEERVVIDAYVKGQQVRAEAFNTRVVDEAAFTSAMEGTALSGARVNVKWRIDKNLWTIGRVVLNVLSVQVSGTTATMRVCNFDASSEVDKTGQNVIQPPGSVGAVLTFVQRDGVWRGASGVKDTARCDAVALMKKHKTAQPTTP